MSIADCKEEIKVTKVVANHRVPAKDEGQQKKSDNKNPGCFFNTRANKDCQHETSAPHSPSLLFLSKVLTMSTSYPTTAMPRSLCY